MTETSDIAAALRIARGYIADDVRRGPIDYDPREDLARVDRAIAALAAAPEPPAPAPAVQGWRVKPLKWQGNSWPKIANFSFGQYSIYSDFEIFFNGYLVKNDGRHSFEGAQEIVRADLEARISAAIEPAPVVSPEEHERIVAENARLREAVAPFAALYVDSVTPHPDGSARERDDAAPAWGFRNSTLTWGDFRLALAALKGSA